MSDEELLRAAENNITKDRLVTPEHAMVLAQQSIAASLLVIARNISSQNIESAGIHVKVDPNLSSTSP